MKRKLLFTLITFCSCALYAQNFIHTTYLIGHSLKDAEKVKQIDYQNFQYIYLMAAPKWNQEDFTRPHEEIIQKLVTEHQYIKDQNVEVIPLLIEQAHKNGTKVLLSFAGEGFKERVSSAEQQRKFIDMMMRFIDKYNYDGIEIDWEKDLLLPLHADFLSNIRLKLDSLGKECNNKHLYLTTALHSWQVYNKNLANKLSSSVDWINIMTYDMGGGIWGNVPTHNTPLDKIEKQLKQWEVFDRNKLCIGLANYGFIYKNLSPGSKIEGKLREYGKYFSYNDMLPLLQEGWTEEYDSNTKVSYYFSPDRSEFITMENPKTILTKIQWITKEKYKGGFWWEFSYDAIDPTTKAGKIKHHLIDVASQYLNSTGY
ncbi:MAG: glycosyl hydrolase family 18 protein [Bacteroides xylanisolvens]